MINPITREKTLIRHILASRWWGEVGRYLDCGDHETLAGLWLACNPQ